MESETIPRNRETSSTESSDTEVSLIARIRRRNLDNRHPEDEEYSRFFDFHNRLQVSLGRYNSTSSSTNTSSSIDNSTSDQALESDSNLQRPQISAALNTQQPLVDLSARLPVVLNYRRREQSSSGQDDTVEGQVDDPLTYFYSRTSGEPLPGLRHSTLGNMNNSSGVNHKFLKIYADGEWEKIVNDMSVSFNDLNSLIMNYLVVEGYQDAAQKFAQEAKINMAASGLGLSNVMLPYNSNSSTNDSSSSSSNNANGAGDQAIFNSVHDRMVIKNFIHTGQIQSAIEKINDVDPELLDTHGDLHFALLRLQLIELIRACNYPSTLPKNSPIRNTVAPGDIAPALEFATQHLARRAPANPKFLADLERTMALLCFPPDSLVPELRDLMDAKLRQTVAREVNTIILTRQGISGESKMLNLVKLWAWGEHELANEKVVFPRLEKSSLFG